jgi:predicted enzyme related to lactoylglutathione lyase
MSHEATHEAERRIDNIEFNVADIARSKRFYGEVFGWQFTDWSVLHRVRRWPAEGRLRVRRAGACSRRTAGDPVLRGPGRCTAARGRRRWRSGAGGVRLPGGRRFHFRDLDGYELAVWSDVD